MLGFRAMQALMDLRAAAGRQSGEALKGISDHVPPADRQGGADRQAIARVILRQGCRLERREDARLPDALLLAASQPETNAAAFTCATAILLADRIQMGLGQDNLSRHWEAFRDTYAMLPRHDRAAIFQGYLVASDLGRVRIEADASELPRLSEELEPLLKDLRSLAAEQEPELSVAVAARLGGVDATLARPHLRALLAGTGQQALTGDSLLFAPLLSLAAGSDNVARAAAAVLLAEALSTSDGEGWFAITLWPERIRDWLALPPRDGRAILAGLRYLYESDPAWVPVPERLVSPRHASSEPLLPVLDDSYGQSRPGDRLG
ncbi:hypothetical protein [Aliiruegeria haliotis]|nr:hypothetical protein [Aliiruegeria haliotis]